MKESRQKKHIDMKEASQNKDRKRIGACYDTHRKDKTRRIRRGKRSPISNTVSINDDQYMQQKKDVDEDQHYGVGEKEGCQIHYYKQDRLEHKTRCCKFDKKEDGSDLTSQDFVDKNFFDGFATKQHERRNRYKTGVRTTDVYCVPSNGKIT